MRANTALNGPQLVGRTIRPPRVAYIVSTPEECQAFVEVASLTWGGKYFCPVPYDPTSGIAEEWWRVMAMYDPDEIVSCLPLDLTTERRLLRFVTPDYVQRDDIETLHIEVWNLRVDGDSIRGISLYSALAGAKQPEKQAERQRALVVSLPPDDSLRLFASARYGCLNEEEAETIVSRTHLPSATRLHDFVTVDSTDLPHGLLDAVLREERTWVYLTRQAMIDYTLVGLEEQTDGREWTLATDDPSRDHDSRLLFISETANSVDFCWFWNLRAQRGWPTTALPLWLPLAVAEEHPEQYSALFRSLAGGYLLSTTIPLETLQILAARLGEGIQAIIANLDEFYCANFELGQKDYCEVFFRNGSVRLPIPRSDVTSGGAVLERHYLDVNVPDYELPSLNIRRWSRSAWQDANFRASRTGLSFSQPTWRTLSTEPIQFTIPTPWQILESCAKSAGYELSISDKGLLAERVVDLTGDTSSLWMISGRTVEALLAQLAELWQAREFKVRLKRALQATVHVKEADATNILEQIVKLISSDYHERVFRQFGNMSKVLHFKNEETARRMVQWMVHRRLLLRGALVRCPACQSSRWVSVDDLRIVLECPGCRQISEIGLEVSATNWTYRLNSLVAKAYDQGVFPHLQVLSYYLNNVGPHPTLGSNTGWLLGANLKAIEPQTVPFPDMEVDVVLLEAGELVIAECKTHGRELEPVDVSKYVDLGKRLKCKKLVFAAGDDFTGIDPRVLRLIEGSPVPVDLLTGDDLFDQFPVRDLLAAKYGATGTAEFEGKLASRLPALA